MFRLQVKFKGRWKWGIVVYETLSEATDRVEKLKEVGIKARIRNNNELFN